MAGLTEVPVVIKELSDAYASALALIENLQREDLDPIEEAEGYKYLMDTYGVTQEEAAQKVGKSRSAVANLMRLLALPKDVLELVRSKTLSSGHARTLLPLEDAALISQFAKEVIAKGLSVRETEKWVKDFLKPQKPTKPVPEKDKYFTEVELSLCETLARKVSVKGSEKGGSITIEFFDKDDLMKIAKFFEE